MSDVKINWFEIPVRDLDRAARFYGAVLGTEFADMEGPTGVIKCFQSEGRPIGALVARPDDVPSRGGVVIYFETDDLEAALARAQASGGKIALPKTAIGPYGFIGRVEDSEGNHMSLHSA